MKYKKHDRVKHPTMESWGLGEVLEDSTERMLRVFFVGVGEKKLVLDIVEPIKVDKEKNKHPILDNLKLSDQTPAIKYKSLPSSIEYFLSKFPEGFKGEKYLEEERNYKVSAHTSAKELLGENHFLSLVEKEDYEEITKIALKIVNSTNLIFPNEKMALKDGLSSLESKKQFSNELFNLLYGKDDFSKNFQSFCTFLDNIKAGKWTTATYFPYIFQPEKYMFVKPTITQHAADLSRFEICYSPQVNWKTYKLILNFSEYLRTALVELEPRDMIDIQSFMWCVAPRK